MKRYICNNCGNTEFEESTIDKVFNIGEKFVLVKKIPALICVHCQEPVLTSETVEEIRILIHSDGKPKEVISTDVYEYA